MNRSDSYFLTSIVGLLVFSTLNGLWMGAVPAEWLQVGFLGVLLTPLVWPMFGRWVGVEPLWSAWRRKNGGE